MMRIYQVCLIGFVSIIVFVLVDFGDANDSTRYRQRRYLSIRNTSKFFGITFSRDYPIKMQNINLKSIDVFSKTRLSFIITKVRLNFKANMVPWTQIFAQAVGFRLNYDEPPESEHPYHHLRVRRSTFFKHLEILFDRNGLSGFHCIRRAICEMRITTQAEGIYHRILEIIFRKTPATEDWFNFSLEECPTSISLCPISLLDVSQYTDL